MIDAEINALVDEAYQRAKKLLSENRDKMELLARRLIEKEVMDIDEARVLLSLPDQKVRESIDAVLTDNNPQQSS